MKFIDSAFLNRPKTPALILNKIATSFFWWCTIINNYYWIETSPQSFHWDVVAMWGIEVYFYDIAEPPSLIKVAARFIDRYVII